MTLHAHPFQIASPLRNVPAIGPILLGVAEKALAFEHLAKFYHQLPTTDSPGYFAQQALDSLHVDFEVSEQDRARIPTSGPVIVVANHPYGGIEGLFLIATLSKLRSDVKFLGNKLLYRIPELREVLLPVDILGGKDAAKDNAASIRLALRHVRNNGLLMLFPAGEVAHLHASMAQVCDPQWSAATARLVRLSNASVVPVYIEGRNSFAFHAAGLLHPRVRTALLTREFLNKRQRTIGVRIGNALSATQLGAIDTDTALASFLRMSTYALANAARVSRLRTTAPRLARQDIQPITASVGGRQISREIEALPSTQTLARSRNISVVYATAEQIPSALQEVGRLREITFRAVGEGTGSSCDLDRFDDHYTHLLLWHEVHREIAGAYRVGCVDHLTACSGREGLYTHSLFAYSDAFLAQLGPALELGRSFVRQEYQKSYSPLLLLWRGIAAFVARHPHYRTLFGPVSISADYQPQSRALLLEYLKRHCYDERLARMIRPRHAVKYPQAFATLDTDWQHLSDVNTISSLLTQIEPDGKGIPVLLRQYLNLNGKLLGFNEDARFGHAIDALIMVDLLQTPQSTLCKYMGREAANNYYRVHRRDDSISVNYQQ